jgi:hypothetical protein
MPKADSELLTEIAKLEAERRQLTAALGEFEHESRRVRDALERRGGRSPEHEARAKALDRNRRRTERDLALRTEALARLRRRAAESEAER